MKSITTGSGRMNQGTSCQNLRKWKTFESRCFLNSLSTMQEVIPECRWPWASRSVVLSLDFTLKSSAELNQNLGLGARSEIHCWRKRQVNDGLGWNEESRAWPPYSPRNMSTAFQACSVKGVYCIHHHRRFSQECLHTDIPILSLGWALTKKCGEVWFWKTRFL